jgi:selenocysteine-specific elongation factor
MDELDRLGLTPPVPPVAGRWVVDPDHLHTLQQSLRDLVRSHAVARPLDPGPTVEAAARVLDVPDREVVAGLLRPPLALRAGRVVDTSRATLPAYVVEAVGSLSAELAAAPFAAPDAERLAALRLGAAELAAAERAGALVRVADGVVLLPSAVDAAAGVLGRLPQPFSVGEARTALRTTRRVAVPLLELLDRRGKTRRGADDRRVIVARVT